MSRIVCVNNKFLSEEDAKISIFDRGLLFGDSVYEVTTVINGLLVGWEPHLKRLKRSLKNLGINFLISDQELLTLHKEIVRKNNIDQGLIYMQISRGVCDRDFLFDNSTEPTLIIFSQKENILTPTNAKNGIKVIFDEDIRWGRRDIKTTQLLAASLCKTKAKKLGKDDAWMIQDGHITEGTSNNAFIINKQNKIITRNLSNDILPGINRSILLKLIEKKKMNFEERPFTISEAENAIEAFVTSASCMVTPVIEINNKIIADGKPGSLTRKLRKVFIEESIKNAI